MSVMHKSRRTPLPVRIGIGVLLLAGLAVLFMRSLDTSRAEPFTVRGEHLAEWTLASDAGATGEAALVALTPPPELPMRLFRQVFTRAGESLSTPLRPGVALVTADELRGANVSADELSAMARAAGLDRARLTPACMGYRRDSKPGATRQVYFLVFDMPEFSAFRQAVSARVAAQGGAATFSAAALSPVMLLAGQPDTTGWMPVVVDGDKDCVAPVVAE
jgi:hypothetical protein